VDSVKQRYGGERTLVVDLENAEPPLQIAGATVVDVDGPRQWLRFRPAETTAAEVVAEVTRQARIIDLAIEEPEIEDVVRRIYTEGRTATPPT
jgi:ABC-2 type transport system ATP-binding protein